MVYASDRSCWQKEEEVRSYLLVADAQHRSNYVVLRPERNDERQLRSRHPTSPHRVREGITPVERSIPQKHRVQHQKEQLAHCEPTVNACARQRDKGVQGTKDRRWDAGRIVRGGEGTRISVRLGMVRLLWDRREGRAETRLVLQLEAAVSADCDDRLLGVGEVGVRLVGFVVVLLLEMVVGASG